MANRKDVAKLAGVSGGTISNVFTNKGNVAPETVIRVKEAAKKLKYVPNHIARSLTLGRTNHIGIAVNEPTNPYHMEIAIAIEKEAILSDYMVTIFDLDSDVQNKLQCIERRQLDALINFTTINCDHDFVELLYERGAVLVNFGTEVGMSFAIDTNSAIIEIMQKIAQLGHKNVGFVSTLDSLQYAADGRCNTMNLQRKTLLFDLSDDLIEYNSTRNTVSEDVGYTGCLNLMKRRPDVTCIMATNDMAAIGVMKALDDLGYKIPADVSVIGHDGINLTRLYTPSITTIGFSKVDYGNLIADKIIEHLKNKTTCLGENYSVKGFPIYRNSLGTCNK